MKHLGLNSTSLSTQITGTVCWYCLSPWCSRLEIMTILKLRPRWGYVRCTKTFWNDGIFSMYQYCYLPPYTSHFSFVLASEKGDTRCHNGQCFWPSAREASSFPTHAQGHGNVQLHWIMCLSPAKAQNFQYLFTIHCAILLVSLNTVLPRLHFWKGLSLTLSQELHSELDFMFKEWAGF